MLYLLMIGAGCVLLLQAFDLVTRGFASLVLRVALVRCRRRVEGRR